MATNDSRIHLDDIYTTPGEAAKLLLVNRLTILRWVKSGKLRGERIGRIYLILKEDAWRIAKEHRIRVREIKL